MSCPPPPKKKTMCWTYCAPGSGPPLVVCRGHIPAAVSGMASGVLGVSVGLIVDALAVGDGGARVSAALLFRRQLLIRVTEGLVHRLVVVGADHLPGGSSNATSHWALGTESRGVTEYRCRNITLILPILEFWISTPKRRRLAWAVDSTLWFALLWDLCTKLTGCFVTMWLEQIACHVLRHDVKPWDMKPPPPRVTMNTAGVEN